ncbi:MAG: hypothetical protein WD426_11685, partial [Anditalea sp.]
STEAGLKEVRREGAGRPETEEFRKPDVRRQDGRRKIEVGRPKDPSLPLGMEVQIPYTIYQIPYTLYQIPRKNANYNRR